MKNLQSGAFYALVSAILFSIGGLFIKLIPWSGYSINAARNFFTLATKMTSAANAIVLQFSAPIFIILIAWGVLKKPPKPLDIKACIIVFIGIICFFLDSLSIKGITGNLVALISGISYAVYFSYKDLTGADYDSVLFYGQILSILIGLPALCLEANISVTAMAYAAILGIFQMGLAYLLLSKAIEMTSAITASLISAIEPILNPILVALFYGETIGSLSIIGACIVVVGIVGYQVWNVMGQRLRHKAV